MKGGPRGAMEKNRGVGEETQQHLPNTTLVRTNDRLCLGSRLIKRITKLTSPRFFSPPPPLPPSPPPPLLFCRFFNVSSICHRFRRVHLINSSGAEQEEEANPFPFLSSCGARNTDGAFPDLNLSEGFFLLSLGQARLFALPLFSSR